MKLYKIYKGIIKSMNNTPCKIAIFTDENNIKIFQKEYFINQYGIVNWSRNSVLENKYKSLKALDEKLILSDFTVL